MPRIFGVRHGFHDQFVKWNCFSGMSFVLMTMPNDGEMLQ